MNTLRDRFRGAKRKHADEDAKLIGNAAASVKMPLVRALPTEQMVDWPSCDAPTPQVDLTWMDRRPFPLLDAK